MRFTTLGFYHESVSSGPFQIFTKICEIFAILSSSPMSFTHKLVMGVNDTGDKLLPVSLTAVIRPCSVFYRFKYTSDN